MMAAGADRETVLPDTELEGRHAVLRARVRRHAVRLEDRSIDRPKRDRETERESPRDRAVNHVPYN